MSEPAIEISIFPLSNLVLLPRVSVPLHVFEERYRDLARAARDGDGLIGMVVVRPEHVAEMGGDPPVFEVGCAGRIRQIEELPDGRFNLVLEGLHRFRIVDEPERPAERSYRVARIELLHEPREPRDLEELRTRIVQTLAELVAGSSEALDEERLQERVRPLDDETFVNAITQSLELPAEEKQLLIETNGVSPRCERLLSLLEFRVAERRSGAPPERQRLN